MLVNLVENAMRHAGPQARIRVRAARQGPDIVAAVIDDGPGIPESERARVFDRFYRLERNRSTPGSGLGLSLVAAVARLHGAVVDLTDAHPGLQARVTIPARARPGTLGFPNSSDSSRTTSPD
jgi:signal transduction histidine kinase